MNNDEQKDIVVGQIVEEKKERKIDLTKYNLLISIIFFIFGAVLATNPGNIVEFITYIIGGTIILVGAIKIILFLYAKKKYDIVNLQDIISGIILCALGIAACIFGKAIETLIRIIVGAWILYCGISNTILVIKAERKFNIKNPMLIISLIMIVLGLCTILIQFIGFRALGIMIILYSIADIVNYIMKQKIS